MLLLCQAESSGGGFVLAWLLTPIVSGHGVTAGKETGSFLRAGWAAGSQQADGLWLDTFATVCCPLAQGPGAF